VRAVLTRFVALTAINPMTAIYFVVLAAGLGGTVAGWAAGCAFVAGVFAASLAWQLALAAFGSLAGARMPGWARTATGVAGHLVVAGYAVRLAAG
jgi:arginine exporter protein ArgO